jgi:hypothetical protein
MHLPFLSLYQAVARARHLVHLSIRNSSTHSENGIGIDHAAIYLSWLTFESMRRPERIRKEILEV